MNKLKTMLCAVFTLLLVNITSAQADSGNFAGPYVGVTASGYGMQLSGSSETGGETTGATAIDKDEVDLGKVAPVVGFEIGYALPVGSAFLLDVNGTYFQGESKMSFTNDDTDSSHDVGFTVDDLRTISIAPTLVLSDTSSVYIKVGLTEADVGVSGDVTTPSDLSGTTWAMGTKTVLDSGIFIKTEAGYTDYNGISAHGKGTNVDADNAYSAEPTVAFGAVSLGFRF